MAIAGTLVAAYTGNLNMKAFDITCLDADTGPTNIAHGLLNITASSMAMIVPITTAAAAVVPNWSVTLTTTNIVLSKQNNAGSGGGVPGTTVMIRVFVWTPHSSIQ